MAKGIVPQSAFSFTNRESTGAAGSDLLLTQLDANLAHNGTLVLLVETVTSGSDLANLEVWTSSTSDFGSSGTQLTAQETRSDSIAQVLITSDASNLFSTGTATASVSDVTISSNRVSAINQVGMYVFNCKNISRFIQVQYDSDGTGMKVAQVFIGQDVRDAPVKANRAAF